MQRVVYRLSFSVGSVLLFATGCATPPPAGGLAPHEGSIPLAPHFSVAPSRTVYLDGPASLAELEAEDPAHYATVKRILAAADAICSPGPLTLQHVGENVNGLACEGMLLKTSNPPKRQISFTLDDTRYIALVVLTQDQPRLTPAQQVLIEEPR